MIKVTENEFWKNRTWKEALFKWEESAIADQEIVAIFDQNGYKLTKLEQLYSIQNNQPFVLHREEKSLRKDWMTYDYTTTGPNLNHSFLFERKGYSGDALKQLKYFANRNNLIYKLINYKGKWGVDFSMDYVDSSGNSMEIIHFEYDSYNLDEIQEIKGRVEEKMVSIDWDWAAKILLEKKNEWIELEFFEQSKWKTDFFDLPAERFKVLAWE